MDAFGIILLENLSNEVRQSSEYQLIYFTCKEAKAHTLNVYPIACLGNPMNFIYTVLLMFPLEQICVCDTFTDTWCTST